jgi:hypothetical protein
MPKNSPAATAIQKKKMIDALVANFGNVHQAAKALKMDTRTHYRWLSEDSEYAQEAENIRDISYRKVKDNLLENALKKIEKGDSAVLNKMLGIYFKKLPEEMERVSHYNNVRTRVMLKIAPHPSDFYSKDPMTQLAVKRYMQDKEKDGKLGELRQDLVQKYKDGTIGEGEPEKF